jgi:predicted ATPase/DNA-binding XRE family transcriptional regulator
MIEISSFGAWLKHQRESRHITQETLTGLLGYSDRSSVTLVEQGRRPPSTKFARRVASWLKVPADEQEEFITQARDGRAPLPRRRRTNLPASTPRLMGRFIGREKQVMEILDLLNNPEIGFVTLVGTGGVGKTRLSLQVATRLLDDPAIDIFLIDLAPLSDFSLAIPTIAEVLGVREVTGQLIDETLKGYLRNKRMLLILDNFEHVVGAAPNVSKLVSAAPGVKVLATSRLPLRIRGEKEYPVPPLSLPDYKHLPTLEELIQYEAVRLFIEQATDIKPDFQLTDDNGPAVAEICVRLDGLPLGIELAASRIKYLSPEMMLSTLPSGLALASRGPRDLPPRQQSLRATIEWSYNFLEESERLLFRCLPVFVGGAALRAAQRICSSTENLSADVLESLMELVDNSLLRQEEGLKGEPRYSMLNTIYEYALEKLKERGEEAVLRKKHAHYFMALAEEAEPHLTGQEQSEWLNQLEREQANIRAALRWASQNAEVGDREAGEVGLRIAGAIWRYWYVKGLFTEGREYLARALSLINSLPGANSLGSRAKALNGAGVLAWRQGDDSSAHASLEEALAASRQAGDKQTISLSLNNLGVIAHDQGDYAAAYALHEESLALRRELGDKWGIARSLHNLGRVPKEQGDYLAARALYEESLALRKELGDLLGIPGLLGSLGAIAYELGENMMAYAFHKESLTRYEELGDRGGIATALLNLANATRVQAGSYAARTLYDDSLALYRELGAKPGIASALNTLGVIAQEQEDYTTATNLHKESLYLRRELGDKKGIAACLAGLGGVAVKTGQEARGAMLLGAAESLLKSMGVLLDRDDRLAYEQSIERALSQLGEAEFEQARQDGRAMSMGQAIECATELDLVVVGRS